MTSGKESAVQAAGTLLLDEPMAKYTTWRVGGAARRLYRPAGVADLARFVKTLPEEEPLFWCGLGSNLLVRDGGLDATVIATQGGLGALALAGERSVRAEAGVPCAKVARFCARAGLAGAQFLAGIPGTVGGALAMNAGAFGGETWDRVAAVEVIDRHGELKARPRTDYRVGYRRVDGPPDEWFVAATFDLEVGDPDVLADEIRAYLAKRAATQPMGQPSCGSVFRNPPGDHAARLIEQAGLKGKCVGGACVSLKHANFIINSGAATAADIESLIEHIRRVVRDVHGVELEPEVRMVGERLK